jgi:hypothetical protein
MPLTRVHIDQIAEKLRRMPPAPQAAANTTKQEAVRLLAGEIASLQRRGYALEQIAESLRGEGLAVTTPTLKSYLSRAKARRGRRRSAPPGAAPVVQSPPQLTPKAAAASTKAETPAKTGKEAFLVNDKDSY